MKTVNKLNAKHRKIIEYWIANPTATQAEVAEVFGTSQSWISQIYNSPVFQEELDKRLKEHWKGAVKIAQKTMVTLAEQGDRQAAQYILDSAGYAPKQQIELDNRIINITLDD